jgi:hypothetical protein
MFDTDFACRANFQSPWEKFKVFMVVGVQNGRHRGSPPIVILTVGCAMRMLYAAAD